MLPYTPLAPDQVSVTMPFCGMSDPDMLEIVEREWGRALPAFYAEHVGLMIEAGFHQLAPIEGVAEALASLTLPICVGRLLILFMTEDDIEQHRAVPTFEIRVKGRRLVRTTDLVEAQWAVRAAAKAGEGAEIVDGLTGQVIESHPPQGG
jgi:hypothetical protein